MSDIVELLRRGEAEGVDGWWFVMAEAADEIEKLRAALKPFADLEPWLEFRDDDGLAHIMVKHIRAAAAALKETGDE